MGLVRTLLAISVVFTHSYGFLLVGGQYAVQIFYMISGYLISFVLIESRNYKSVWKFYLNRALRLFPVYWLVLAVSLLAIGFASAVLGQEHQLLSTYESAPFWLRAWLTLSNVFVVGQDLLMFSAVRNDELVLLTDFRASDYPLWQGLAVPQAWTIGVELTFYAIAPFILHRQRWLCALLFFSLLLRIFFIGWGFGTQDPWSYRFFPTELALFLLGALSHQLWAPVVTRTVTLKNASEIATLMLAVFICSFWILPQNFLVTSILFLSTLFCLPLLFLFQERYEWDRRIGELSYPVYITHMLVIWVFGYALKLMGIDYKSFTGALIIVILTVLVSALVNWTVSRYIERVRRQIKAS
ncbi:MAG: acyltransferase family protein [Aequoribacter sp.]|uniref:acyltransferase family protein n=1 Tax=Aequoribacter sp. TaxID=2847771 RepID=UPI003C332E9D